MFHVQYSESASITVDGSEGKWVTESEKVFSMKQKLFSWSGNEFKVNDMVCIIWRI